MEDGRAPRVGDGTVVVRLDGVGTRMVPVNWHSELAARLAEAERQLAEALASVVLYVNERDAAWDGWGAQVRSEEREMRRRIEAEARADNLAPYVMRSQAAEARVAALTEALQQVATAPLQVECIRIARAALVAADRPEGTTPQEGNA